MNILAIDTSGDILSLAIYKDGETIALNVNAKQNQASIIYAQLDELLKVANLTLEQCQAIAFGRGPGSFTGVRITAACVQGLAIAKDIPVIPISNLEALAYRASAHIKKDTPCTVLASIDARMQEMYCAWYSVSSCKKITALTCENLIAPSKLNFLQAEQEFVLIGNASDYLAKMPLAFRKKIVQNIQTNVHASDIVALAVNVFVAEGGKVAENAMPVYLRDGVNLKN